MTTNGPYGVCWQRCLSRRENVEPVGGLGTSMFNFACSDWFCKKWVNLAKSVGLPLPVPLAHLIRLIHPTVSTELLMIFLKAEVPKKRVFASYLTKSFFACFFHLYRRYKCRVVWHSISRGRPGNAYPPDT